MHLWKSSLTFASLALVCACSGETSAPEATATTEASIIGGVALDSTALDAVGSLVTIYRYSGGQVSYSSPFCTGTLISKRQVLSAEHCVRDSGRGQEYGFAIGADGRRPRKVIPVAVVDIEQSVTGGYLGLGSDVAVLHLGEPVEDVTPFAVGQLTADDVGRRFVGVGYGSQDTQGLGHAPRRQHDLRRDGRAALRAVLRQL